MDNHDLDEWLRIGKEAYGISLIVTVCAYCGCIVGAKDGQGEYGVSHSQCSRCANKLNNIVDKYREGVDYV